MQTKPRTAVIAMPPRTAETRPTAAEPLPYMPTNPAQAPINIVPSRPILARPACSQIVSPMAANNSGAALRTAAASRVM